MQYIEIEPTYKSPQVIFDPSKGKFTIAGKSVLVNVEEFYGPLLSWMDEFLEQSELNEVEFTFDIEYYNLASTKRFVFFLYKLKEVQKKGGKLKVNWLYRNQDTDILEMGQDLSQMLELPFNFRGYEKLHKKVSAN
ncbi:MAG: DUF1987 domain-containing protein [Vicingaceae bacterium]